MLIRTLSAKPRLHQEWESFNLPAVILFHVACDFQSMGANRVICSTDAVASVTGAYHDGGGENILTLHGGQGYRRHE